MNSLIVSCDITMIENTCLNNLTIGRLAVDSRKQSIYGQDNVQISRY